MGLLGDIADFGKDAIEDRDKWADRFKKVGDFTDFFESSLGKRLIRSAKSPILAAGQHVILSMKLTTGVGDPENGERFGQGADRLGNAGETLNSAFPDDSWDSGGSGAYTGRNTEQVGRSETMINADRTVATVLSREAGQIAATRENLDGQSDWLADMSLVTMVTGCIPYVGKAAQISAEIAMVTKAVGESTNQLTTMQRFAGTNAAELQDAVNQYSAVAQDATPTGPDRDFPPTTPTDGDQEKDPEQPGDTPPGESLAGPTAPGAPGPGTPSGGGGGAPTPQSAPAAPSMPSGLPSAPQPAAAGGDMTGAMIGAMGSVLGSLGGILGAVAQAAQVAAQAATQAAGQQAQDPAADDPEAGEHRVAEKSEKGDEPKPGEDPDQEMADDQANRDVEQGSGEGADDVPANDGAADDGAAKTLPPDLQAASAGGGDAGRAPVHIEVDFNQDQLRAPVTVKLDPDVPGSATRDQDVRI